MKQTMSLLLVLAMLLSLFAGCGTSMPDESTGEFTEEAILEATLQPAETAEATTEPTLSPEEVLYNSLPDRMKQAVDLGIVELSQMEDPERIVTVGEASAMLQKAFVHRTGVESMTLRDLMASADFSTRNATRGWILNIPGLADTELVKGDQYESYEQWMKLSNRDGGEHLWYDFRYRTHAANMELISTGPQWLLTNDGDSYANKPCIDTAQDWSVCETLMQSDLLYGPGQNASRFDSISEYALAVYDGTNGCKFFTFENGCLNPETELTVEAAAEYALIYYNYPNPVALPTFVAPEDVGGFNPEIITADLLEKETDLPEASCQNLPGEWRGVVMDDFQYVDSNSLMHLDYEIYEYEIQQVKEAGFNFISLNLDFSWLQENMLNDKSLAANEDAFGGLVNKEDVGKLSLQQLEKLDRVIALCMKYDIHVNLRCTAVPNMNNDVLLGMHYQIFRNSDKYIDSLSRIWQAIARRYAEISNEYLSFTLFGGDYPVTNKMLVPSVHAIREESPDRCIIAEICSYLQESGEFAELGVALSYKLYEPEKTDYFFNLNTNEHWGKHEMNSKGKNVIQNFSWPYQGKVDAQALFEVELYGKMESMMEVMETAQEYGVGFMLGNFGVSSFGDWWMALDRVRYADEPYFAMIEDITSSVEELGYGWCFNRWYGPYGVAFCLPAIQTSTYEQVEDYPYYIDQGMMGLFQSINGIA